MDEDAYKPVMVAKDVIGGTADDYAGTLLGEMLYKLALCLVYSIVTDRGGSGVIVDGTVTHREGKKTCKKRGGAFIVFLEKLGAYPGTARRLGKQFLVVIAYVETSG